MAGGGMSDMEPLEIPGAWMRTPFVHRDERGSILEWFRAAGTGMDVVQANLCVTRKSAIRGIHFADGMAKYVTCVSGSVLDVVVDVREGSPAFGQWAGVLLGDADGCAVFLAGGLGHAVMALSDEAAVVYLCSLAYDPARERRVHPLDPAIGIGWPRDVTPILSAADASAPTLAEAQAAGLLPAYREGI